MKKIITAVSIIAIGALVFAGYRYWSSSPKFFSDNKTEIVENVKTAPKEAIQEKEFVKTSGISYSIAFYQNQDLVALEFKDGKTSKPKSISTEKIDIVRTAKYFTTSLMPKEIISAMPLSPNMIFYSGLQSNISENEWMFVERDMQSTTYNLCLYNHATKSKSILFNQNSSPNSRYAFKPIAWLSNGSTVILEALVFGSSTEHEGIWAFNLISKVAKQLDITSNYSNTPQISPDGKYLLYCATSSKKDIHVPSKRVLVYDIESKREQVVIEDDKDAFVMAEWINIPLSNK